MAMNQAQTIIRQELNAIYVDLIVTLTKKTGTLSVYELADLEGFLAETETELKSVNTLAATAAPTAAQETNKVTIKEDVTAAVAGL